MSCEDIPSLLDLQNTKKHVDDFGHLMGTGTGTSTNGVTGQVRPTYNKVINDMNSEFDGMISDMNSEFDTNILNMGFTRIGTFSAGATITNPRQTLLWDVADGGDGQEYGWSGVFLPSGKIVPPGSTPHTTGGIAVGAWMSRFDPELQIIVFESLRRSYAEAGYNLVSGSFEAGGTLVNANDVLLHEASGKAYAYTGTLPVTVQAGFNPVGNVDWKPQTDHTLRTDLAYEGAGLVGYRYSGIGTRRTVRTKLDERVSLVDFHHIDGVYVTPGPGVDSRPYIQSAIDYLESIGGGTLIIPETTSGWYLGSYGGGGLTAHAGIIQLRSDVNIELNGKVQLDDYFSGKVFQIFVGFDGDAASSTNLNNVHIYGGGIIDFGNFPEPTSGNVLRNGIAFGKSYNCSLRHVTMQNGDITWAVTTGWNGYGDATYVEDCKFSNLVQTTQNPDHSTIYINSPHSGVRRCSFYIPAARGRDIACAVELHQHDNWFEDCAISGYARGCYVTMHGAEAMGAGTYTYNVKVKGNSGDIAGQFAVFVADLTNGVQGHINGVIVSDNIIIQPEGYANGAFILYAEGKEGLVNLDVSGVLVANNRYATPSTSDSTAFQSSVTVNGVTFIGNYFDTRRAVKGPGNNLVCRGLIWDESNVIGPAHSGVRTGISLFELRYTTVVNTHIVAKLRSPDTSMFSVILVPPACVIRDSVLIVRPDFITTDRNAIVYEGNQQNSDGLQTEYPIMVEFTTPMSSGVTPYMSTSTAFGWASSATPLSNASGLTFYTPSAFSVKGTGQLGGIGWNDLTESRTVYIMVLIKRFL